MGHCSERGMETLVGDKSHIYLYEQGGIAQVSLFNKGFHSNDHHSARLLRKYIISKMGHISH